MGSIVVTGRVRVSSDPLRGGVELAGGAGVERLALRLDPWQAREPGTRLLSTDDVLRVAGFDASDPESIESAKDRQRVAAFLYREGRTNSAWSVLGFGEPSRDPADRAFVANLVEDVRARLDVAAENREARQAEALSRLNALRRRRGWSHDRERTLEQVTQLLAGWADVLGADEARELREMRAELRGGASSTGGEQELRELFGPDALEVSALGRARLEYHFTASEAGAWQRGDWKADGRGWTSPGGDSPLDPADADKGPRLLLREPLDLESGRFVVDLLLEHVSPGTLLGVSAAGFQVLARSDPAGGRIAVVTGTAEDAAGELASGGGVAFRGFARGEQHRLRLSVNQSRGHAILSLDGVQLLERHSPSPKGQARSRSVSIQTADTVRLVEATIEVDVRD